MNKTEAIQALEAAIKQGNEVLNQLKESEPKEGCTFLNALPNYKPEFKLFLPLKNHEAIAFNIYGSNF